MTMSRYFENLIIHLGRLLKSIALLMVSIIAQLLLYYERKEARERNSSNSWRMSYLIHHILEDDSSKVDLPSGDQSFKYLHIVMISLIKGTRITTKALYHIGQQRVINPW